MRTPARLAEILVLVVGGLALVGLGWAVFRAGEDPELVVRMEVERDAERTAQLLQLTWERIATSPEPPGDRPWFDGHVDDLAAPVRVPALDREAAGGGSHPLDVLLADASARGDREALAEVLERFPDAPRRPEAMLRAIQMAVADDDADAACALWTQARAELEPHEARGDVAYLLIDFLAAASALTDAERAEGQALLAEHWAAGRLAMPAPQDDWIVGEGMRHDPRLEAWISALKFIAPQHADAVGRAADWDGRNLRVVMAPFGAVEELKRDGRWHGLEGFDWIARVSADGEVAAAWRSGEELARLVLREAGVGEGFSLDGLERDAGEDTGEDTGRVVRIAERDWPLRHTGRDALVAAEAARQRNLRLGFGVLCLLSAAAVRFTYTALVRRRRLDDLKIRFVAGVSHDLRTPLASILLMAENLESGRVTDAERQAVYHGSIRREATRLGRMVDDVLDFSRLERGEGIKLAREEWRLDALADQLETECRERVEKVGGVCRVLRQNLPEHGVLDAEALRRAVGNLVDNALAHSGSTELELVMCGAGEALVVEVADAGCGVPRAERERLFQAFEQGRSDNGHTGGSGLGLAIVRELVRAHGGDATFVEQPVGTRVRLTLALTEAESAA